MKAFTTSDTDPLLTASPDKEVSVREVFGVDSDMMVPAFSEADEHVPDLDESQISERESNQQHFLSITYTINAKSREQIVALATALQASKDVIMLI